MQCVLLHLKERTKKEKNNIDIELRRSRVKNLRSISNMIGSKTKKKKKICDAEKFVLW